jgi:outer membrane protein
MRSIFQNITVAFAIILIATLSTPTVSSAQSSTDSTLNRNDSTLETATLDQVVAYALVNQPAVQQALLDEEITHRAIRGRLADWYPQVDFGYNYQRTFDRPTFVGPDGNVNTIGMLNTSATQVTATQTIFNRDVLLAASTASKVRLQADQNTARSKIETVVNVSKAFYDLLATQQQIKVAEESIVRLQRSLKDAKSRYASGLSDKTDYKRATILLGNAEASLKSNQELLKYKESYLKTLMGYPAEAALPLQYDTLQMEGEIYVDTLQQLNYTAHIDYRILYMQRELQNANVKYANWAFLPTLSAYGAYVLNYQNNEFGELYGQDYPNSYAGVRLAFPIFQGGKRIAKMREQRLTRDRLDVGLTNLQNVLNTEYMRALAVYKSNLNNFLVQRENVALATEVYDVINLQYRNGIRTYLDVTVAESDLRTTRINYYNALYQILASKIDVMRALGQINY